MLGAKVGENHRNSGIKPWAKPHPGLQIGATAVGRDGNVSFRIETFVQTSLAGVWKIQLETSSVCQAVAHILIGKVVNTYAARFTDEAINITIARFHGAWVSANACL